MAVNNSGKISAEEVTFMRILSQHKKGILHEEKIGDDLVSFTRNLTEKIFSGKWQGGGLLGGEYGYGVNFENDVFMMHKYCWCEKDDCPWCTGEMPNFLHRKSNIRIFWYKWIGRSMEINKKITLKKWKEIINDCLKSIE